MLLLISEFLTFSIFKIKSFLASFSCQHPSLSLLSDSRSLSPLSVVSIPHILRSQDQVLSRLFLLSASFSVPILDIKSFLAYAMISLNDQHLTASPLSRSSLSSLLLWPLSTVSISQWLSSGDQIFPHFCCDLSQKSASYSVSILKIKPFLTFALKIKPFVTFAMTSSNNQHLAVSNSQDAFFSFHSQNFSYFHMSRWLHFLDSRIPQSLHFSRARFPQFL